MKDRDNYKNLYFTKEIPTSKYVCKKNGTPMKNKIIDFVDE